MWFWNYLDEGEKKKGQISSFSPHALWTLKKQMISEHVMISNIFYRRKTRFLPVLTLDREWNDGGEYK